MKMKMKSKQPVVGIDGSPDYFDASFDGSPDYFDASSEEEIPERVVLASGVLWDPHSAIQGANLQEVEDYRRQQLKKTTAYESNRRCGLR